MKKVNIDIINLETDNAAKVVIGGDITLKNCNQIKSALVEVKNKYNSVDLQVESITDMDLSAVQLLLSFRSSMKEAQKPLTVGIDLPESIEMLMEKGGFLKYSFFN